MRIFILCILIIPSVLARLTYESRLEYGSDHHLTHTYGNLQKLMKEILAELAADVMEKPNKEHEYWDEMGRVSLHDYSQGAITVSIKWTPGTRTGPGATGLYPPHYTPTSDEITEMWMKYIVMWPYLSTLANVEMADSCRRGGHFLFDIVDDSNLRGSPPPDMDHMVPHRGPRSNGVPIKRDISELLPMNITTNTTVFTRMTREEYLATHTNTSTFLSSTIPNVWRPSNGPELCPREDREWAPMSLCKSRGTMIAGTTLNSKSFKNGVMLRSSNGNTIQFSDDGRLIITAGDANGKNKSIYFGGVDSTSSKKPFSMTLHTNGDFCFYDKDAKNYYCTAIRGPNDGQYRATIQGDGNLVVYRGRGIDQPLWSSGTNWKTVDTTYGCTFPKPR